MRTKEVKMQCFRMACEVLGIGNGYKSTVTKGEIETGVTRGSPSVNEILVKAEEIFRWVDTRS